MEDFAMDRFILKAPYKPTGDQPQAIEQLVKGFKEGNQCQTLLGVTGSGKTFTMANVIERLQKPTLVIAHNKTLAAQLYGEFKEMFPDNAVEYFVSYYDYYQPEAYVPSSDTYIAKDSAINDEIDKLRLSATMALVERKDVIIVDDMISSGESMLDVAKKLKDRNAARVFVCTTFGLFTDGFEKFDEYYKKGYLDKVVTTNLTYLPPAVDEREYFVKADMSKFLALIIDSLNHDLTIGAVMNPTDKIHKLLQKYHQV